jgi:hypothetical protein
MGLDFEEIDMSLEQVFQLKLGNEFWEPLFQPDPRDLAAGSRFAKRDVTVGRVFDELVKRLNAEGRYHEDQTFESTLEDVVERLKHHFGKADLLPTTEFKSLIGRKPKLNDWYLLGPVFLLELAPLKRPPSRLLPFLGIFPVILVAAAFITGIGEHIASMVVATAIPVLLIVIFCAFLDPNNSSLPGYLRTVEGMAEQVHVARIRQSTPSQWSERTVWNVLKVTLVDVLCVDEKLITPTARLGKDLAAI